MQNFWNLLRQGQDFLRSMGIHPLVFVTGVIFLLIFPRVFLLGAALFVCFRAAKKIGFPFKGQKRHR